MRWQQPGRASGPSSLLKLPTVLGTPDLTPIHQGGSTSEPEIVPNARYKLLLVLKINELGDRRNV